MTDRMPQKQPSPPDDSARPVRPSWIIPLVTIGIAALLLGGWQIFSTWDQGTNAVRGRILLWHSWAEEDTPLLLQALDQYRQIHPGARIIAVQIPAAELRQRFEESAALGLGPDLIIGRSQWTAPWVERELIQPLPSGTSTLQYYRPAIDTLTLNNQPYGLPLAMVTQALYFNRELVESAPRTLAELTEAVSEGPGIGLPLGFEPSFWGIGTQGGGFINAEQNLAGSQPAFGRWLTWLQDAQINPGFALARDQQSLEALFLAEQIGYLVAGPESYPACEPVGRPIRSVSLCFPVDRRGQPPPCYQLKRSF